MVFLILIIWGFSTSWHEQYVPMSYITSLNSPVPDLDCLETPGLEVYHHSLTFCHLNGPVVKCLIWTELLLQENDPSSCSCSCSWCGWSGRSSCCLFVVDEVRFNKTRTKLSRQFCQPGEKNWKSPWIVWWWRNVCLMLMTADNDGTGLWYSCVFLIVCL